MEHKILEPIEVTDEELDIISGGQIVFVGIFQLNIGGNTIVISGLDPHGGGGANAFTVINTNTQTNTNSGAALNSGAIGVG